MEFMDINNKTVLVLAPHTDDGEFGCGGSIARFKRENNRVYYIAFSDAEKSVPEEYPRDQLKKELARAMKIFSVDEDHYEVHSYPVREFPLHRQSILDFMILLKRRVNPDVVFLPSSFDTHQDHQTIFEEGFRAFKDKTLLGYEVPWNNLTFPTQAFVLLEEADIGKKIEALKCYETQKDRFYTSEEFIRSLALVRGTQIGQHYCEVFEIIRWVLY